MEYFILWPILAILVGVFANNKGRSGIGHFFIAILLSPLIGMIIVLILPTKLENIEEKAINTGKLKKCPNCAELVKKEALICKHCNSKLAVYQQEKIKQNTAADGIEW